MKPVLALAVLAGLAAATSSHEGVENAAPANKKSAATAALPPPIEVEVVAVDPKARTITVRDIAAVPAPPAMPSR
jgi:hypothetical protein